MLKLKSKMWYFLVGLIFGCLGGLIWQELLAPLTLNPHVHTTQQIKMLQNEYDERLLEYIEGKWQSSIGDLFIEVKNSEVNGNFLVMENLAIKPRRQETFKIVSVDKLDGLFGIVALTLCSTDSKCFEKDLIPVQINKVFGISKTITMSYDTRFSYCILIDNKCTRSFKEID
jgi:hypothetical protein